VTYGMSRWYCRLRTGTGRLAGGGGTAALARSVSVDAAISGLEDISLTYIQLLFSYFDVSVSQLNIVFINT
jgi:hypothetical protein